MVDTHCHLDACEEPVPELVENARAAGVDVVLLVEPDTAASVVRVQLIVGGVGWLHPKYWSWFVGLISTQWPSPQFPNEFHCVRLEFGTPGLHVRTQPWSWSPSTRRLESCCETAMWYGWFHGSLVACVHVLELPFVGEK